MKIIISGIVLVLFMLLLIFAIYQTPDKIVAIQYPIFYGTPSSNGSPENPHARKDWETMRLVDPITGRVPSKMRAKELAFAKELPSDNYYGKVADLEWVSMGPANAGGRTRAAAIDITDEDIMFAGGVSGGLWRTTNGGESWTKVTPPDQHQSVTCIIQDTRPGKTNIWYYGSGEGAGNSATGPGAYYLGNGVYKSTDGGLTWKSLDATVSGSPQIFKQSWDINWRIITHPTDTQDIVYVATIGAIYKSIDGGKTWTITLGGFSYFAYTDLAISSTGVLYATISKNAIQSGIWRSTDGDNWTNITPSNWATEYNRIVIGVSPSNEKEVYFLANTPGSGQMTTYFGSTEWNSLWKYTYLSGNGDSSNGSWVDLSVNLPANNAEFDNFNTQGSYDMVVKVKPDEPNTVFIGGVNLFRSTDGFATPNNIVRVGGWLDDTKRPHYEFYLNHFVDQHELLFYPSNPNKMISANDAGIYRTNDCSANEVKWTSLNNDYVTTQFYTIAIDHGSNNSNAIIGGLQDIGNWFTNSSSPLSSWTNSTVGDGAYCAISDGGEFYYFSRQLGQIVKTRLDNKGVPTAFTRIDPIGAEDYLFVNPFILDPVDNSIMYLAEGKKLWRNHNLDEIVLDNKYDTINTNWDRFTDTLKNNYSVISSLAVSTLPANRLYFGTSNRKVYRVDNANIGDPSFVEITGNIFPYNAYVNCIAVDPRNADKVMVVFSNYLVYSLFYTEDGGANWGKVAGNLEKNSTGEGNGPSCRWATILPTDSGTVYWVATSTGLYATDTLKGLSTEWIQQGANTIGNVVIEMIDARSSDGFIAIGTHGNGVYAANIPEEKKIRITTTQLTVNPSFIQDETTITYQLAKEEQVAIIVYDNLGRRVNTLVSQSMKSGEYTIPYNVNKLSSGIYYVSLTTNDQTFAKKIMVIKE